jgi:DNA-binding response OmpR family regulator
MVAQLNTVRQVYIAGGQDDGRGQGVEVREADPSLLKGETVLVVEDEALVGMELQFELQKAGASVIGPIASLEEAVSVAGDQTFAVAILDIDLRGQDVFPAADELRRRSIPFLFHTGHGRKLELTAGYPGVPVCKKPMNMGRLLRVLAGLLD